MLGSQLVTASRRLPRPSTRSFAELVPFQSTQSPPLHSTKAPGRKRKRPNTSSSAKPIAESPKAGRVPVREDHGLYAFFRRKPGDNLTGEDRYEVVESPEEGRMISGRPWEASELRLKNFKDLHTLWYVAAREQNLLATQKEEVRRMGVTNTELQVPMDKVRNCRKTMAGIKAVLNERRLAYEGAVKLAEQQMVTAKERIVDAADQTTERSKA